MRQFIRWVSGEEINNSKRILFIFVILILLFTTAATPYRSTTQTVYPLPFNVTASDNLSNRILITWEAVCGVGEADHFAIYAKDQSESFFSLIGNEPYNGCQSGVPFEFMFALDGIMDFAYRDYEFKIKTCPEDGYLCPNDYSEVATGSGVIDPPYISATDGTFDDRIEVSFFEYSFNSQLYKVYRSNTIDGTYSLVGTTYGDKELDEIFVDDEVVPGTIYYYKGEVCTKFDDCSPLGDPAIGYASSSGPSGISATDGTEDQYIAITWDEIVDSNGYRIYRTTNNTAPTDPDSYITVIYSEHYEDYGADPYTEYYYWLSAYDTNLGDWTEINGTDSGWRPFEPANTVRASDGTLSGQVDLTWNHDDDSFIDLYLIYRSDSETGDKTRVGSSSTTSFSDRLAVDGNTYYYWVKPCDSTNRCGAMTTYDTGWASMEAASNLVASDGTSTDHVALTWDPVYGATSYKIYRSQTNTPPVNPRATVSTESYNDTSANPAQTYYYWVEGCSDEMCADLSASETGWRAVPVPTNVQASDGTSPNDITVFWTAVPGATVYYAYYADTISGLGSDRHEIVTSSFSDQTVDQGETRFYWIVACVDDVCSDYSPPEEGWRGVKSPDGLAADSGLYDQIPLEWNANSSADHYEVYRAESASGDKTRLADNVTSPNFSDTTMVSGTTYYYWVKACIGTICSDFSSSTTGWARGGTLPVVESLTRDDPSPTNLSQVDFTIAFNKAVTGVDSSDFDIVTTGTLQGASILGVAGSGDERTITVSTGFGSGTLGLKVNDDNTIIDDISNELGGPEQGDGDYSAGEVYIIDKIAPIFASVLRSSPLDEITNADVLVFLAQFSEPIMQVTADDFALTGGSTATITNVQPYGGNTGYLITVSGGDLADFSGSIGLTLADTQNLTDLVGNVLPLTQPIVNQEFTLDNEIPTIMAIERFDPLNEITNADTLIFKISFSKDVTQLSTDDFQLTGGSTAVISDANNNTDPDIAYITISGGDLANYNGSVGIELSASNDITDAVGNPVDQTSPETDEAYLLDNKFPAVSLAANGSPDGTSVIMYGPSTLEVEFSENVLHDGSENCATNPINYLLFKAGDNNTFDTQSCQDQARSNVGNDDVFIPVGPINYEDNDGAGPFVATLTVNNGVSLPVGDYRLLVCGTTSIHDLGGNTLNDGESDTSVTIRVINPSELPQTGFTPNVITRLSEQPLNKAYRQTAGLTLSIPTLGVNRSIVGVPAVDNDWDLSWLDNNIGYLEGSAYPTWPGNSVLTAHAYTAFGAPGPFHDLASLKWGDQVIIHSNGQQYIYEVRSVSQYTRADNLSVVKGHDDYDWVTLITCSGYDATEDVFLSRSVVRAVLIDVITVP
ncbi:sortase [bacterium]|nr:sortase [bacterium]